MTGRQKPIQAVPITPPPPDQIVRREVRFAKSGERRTRYSLPTSLKSSSPIGYRNRVSLNREESEYALKLLSLERPTRFAPPESITEQELFEEVSLGVLSSRQSTNFRGHKQITFGPKDSAEIAALLTKVPDLDAEVLSNASMTHVVLSRPYRTPFTLLLTLIGHRSFLNLVTVPIRAWNKRFHHVDDIPTIGFLPDLHIGILADAQERATVIASNGQRRAQVFMRPFSFADHHSHPSIRAIEAMCGLSKKDRSIGWRVALVTQVGSAIPEERVAIPAPVFRKLGANLLAFRSERIQPGVNNESKAPEGYQSRQDMDVETELTIMAGRAGYNAFTHWTGHEREAAKELLLLERIDVLTPNGKTRLRQVRGALEEITDRVVRNIPLWADLPVGRAFSRNANRGRKAFALAGQRIYIAGLSRTEVEAAGLNWRHAVRSVGAAASRSSLVAEIMGTTNIPEGCDLLAGICMMAGPVNQNDIGKQFYGYDDLLAGAYPHRDPTSLLVWTLKAKTIADPIGNEEQLLNPDQKGALVDLRCGPHELIQIANEQGLSPMRAQEGLVNEERAFSDQHNFVTDEHGVSIPGNEGTLWPEDKRNQALWSTDGP